jgi:di/tricarboxylate transporter
MSFYSEVEVPTWEPWFALVVASMLLVGLALRWATTDLLAISCLAALVVIQNLTGTPFLPKTDQMVAGFGNPALVTVGILFAVVAGLELTGATDLATAWLLRRPKGLVDAQVRLLAPVTVLSAFLNNTPIVAAMLPVVSDLCKRTQLPPSRFFLPLSYAAILGGMCTTIGTSTNLLVNSKIAEREFAEVGFFAPGWVGVPITIIGLVYMILAGRFLLPNRKPVVSPQDDPRRYTVEMSVAPGGPLVNQTIEDAGLRHLPGLFLAEIQRDGDSLPAVAPTERLQAGDLLLFVGMLDSVVDLQKIRGLVTGDDQARKLNVPAWHRKIVEAVVSSRCPMLGKTIREARFRTHYGAAVIAVARGGERIEGKIGDVQLRAGDTLLLEATPQFITRRRESSDFYLVSTVDQASVRRHDRAWWALGILLVMVTLAATETMNILTAALAAALVMIATRCCTMIEARRSIDWSVLLVIGAALGIGAALETSTAARQIADGLLQLAGNNPLFALAAVYVATMVCTELITNNAAALLMFPIGWETAESLQANPITFSMAVMIAASAAFSTPFGYQTNLMVFGPGGYRMGDYVRFGLPLNLIVFVTAMLIIPLVWPISPFDWSSR